MSFRRSGMFRRYTESARRVIFHAAHTAQLRQAKEIEVTDLLLGLARDRHADDCSFRHLHEKREELAASIGQSWLLPSQWSGQDKVQRPLSSNAKRALAFAAQEVASTKCHWLDTDHLQIGVLLADSVSADALASLGYSLETTRRLGREARERYPENRPTVWQRIRDISLGAWVALIFFLGVLGIAIFDTVTHLSAP